MRAGIDCLRRQVAPTQLNLPLRSARLSDQGQRSAGKPARAESDERLADEDGAPRLRKAQASAATRPGRVPC